MHSLGRRDDFHDKLHSFYFDIANQPTFMLINAIMRAFSFVQPSQISTIITNACPIVVMNVKIFGTRANETSCKQSERVFF